MGKLGKLMEAIKFEHTIFSLPFIFIGMIVAAHGWFGWRLFLLGLVAAVSARTFAMMANRYLDRIIDMKNPRTANRPTATGEVDETDMLITIIGSGLLFIGSAYLINHLAFKLSIPILLFLWSYSYFKRFTPVVHLVLGMTLGLAPIAGAIAVIEEIPAWSVFLGIAVMFWVAGFDIIYSIQDLEFDRKEHLYSIPAKIGAEGALIVAQMFHILALLFWALFTAYAGLEFWGWVAVIISAVILYKEHQMVKESYQNIPKAFFEMNGWLGVLYLIMVILNYL
jgi:4-hydroxybenzoate polyprenyltransferase